MASNINLSKLTGDAQTDAVLRSAGRFLRTGIQGASLGLSDYVAGTVQTVTSGGDWGQNIKDSQKFTAEMYEVDTVASWGGWIAGNVTTATVAAAKITGKTAIEVLASPLEAFLGRVFVRNYPLRSGVSAQAAQLAVEGAVPGIRSSTITAVVGLGTTIGTFALNAKKPVDSLVEILSPSATPKAVVSKDRSR